MLTRKIYVHFLCYLQKSASSDNFVRNVHTSWISYVSTQLSLDYLLWKNILQFYEQKYRYHLFVHFHIFHKRMCENFFSYRLDAQPFIDQSPNLFSQFKNNSAPYTLVLRCTKKLQHTLLIFLFCYFSYSLLIFLFCYFTCSCL